jgi:hypothetical protein
VHDSSRPFERECTEVDDPGRVGNDGEGRAVLGYGRLDNSATGPVYPASSLANTTPSTKLSMPVVGLEAWFTQIPPVTRTWLALSVLTSVAVVRAWQMATLAPTVTDLTQMTTDSFTAMSIDNAAATLLQL